MKRAFDILVALGGLIATAPILAIIALLLRIKQGSPVLFRQQRPGRGGKPFDMIKFRTMMDVRLPDGRIDQAVTGIGRVLRSTSLDELPELWNVLTGDMSLVGPRPLLIEYLPLYSPTQARRHEVAPGITGWAQINGRNAISWEEKFAYDVWYVDNRSFALDLKILIGTAARVLARSDVDHSEAVTMPRFTGSELNL